MGFPLTPKSMTLDDLEFLVNFADFGRNNSIVGPRTTGKRMKKIGQYCQRQRCKHVELEQLLADFRVARVCQR